MESSFTLGRIRGIQIGIHYTWLIIFALVTFSLALGFFPQNFPGMDPVTTWIISIIASALLFGSVLVHELAHSFVAQNQGIPVRSITLFLFGGVSNIQQEAKNPKSELFITGAGPLSSIVLGALFAGLLIALAGVSAPLTAVLSYLTIINLLLAAFNLIPGFPLDGGRLLRAAIWAINGSFQKATDIATSVGQGIAYLFIVAGIFLAFTTDFISGIWLAFIGWFLASAAEASRRQATYQRAFEGVEVSGLMNPRPVTVSPDTTLQDLVDDYVLARYVRSIPVVDDDELAGMITLSDISRVHRERWRFAQVADAMTPARHLVKIGPRANVGEALQLMAEHDLNQLPVVEGNRLVGLLSRSHVMRFMQVQEELKKAA